MNIYFYTLGCKVNQYETELLTEAFINAGYRLSEARNADVIVVNSCTVTAESDRKVRQALRRFCRTTDAIIVLCGCLPQAGGDCDGLADIITGNNDHKMIVNAVAKFQSERKPLKFITPHAKDEPYPCGNISGFCGHTRAFVKIEDGCDNFCTYCIIPYSRGRVRSKSPKDIQNEAKALAANGFSEIVLVGINLCNYGKGTNFGICDAVEACAEIKGILRIRLGSLEPDIISKDDLERLAACRKFCPNFHLALQSGCTETLKRMNRHYSAEYYEELVNNIRSCFDHVSITTDIMCGFPGETEEEFKSSVDFCRKIGFARAHIFAYSRRPGTFADKLPNQIPQSVKRERSKVLSETVLQSSNDYLCAMVGKTRSVLFETQDENFCMGYTDDYIHIKVPYKADLLGKIKNVTVSEIQDNVCFGYIND